MRKLLHLALVIIFSLLFFLPVFSSACNEGDEHDGEMGGMITGMAIAEGEKMERSISFSQAKEIIWWINSLLLSLLMLTGIYWLVKNAEKRKS